MVHRAPLPRRRAPAQLRAGGRGGGARTKRVRISTDICLAPFAHPLRLAEDLAVLDNLSNGRMELGLGMGYAPHEFKGFGIPQSRRVSLTEELVEILQLAWSGERFTFHGKRYHVEDVAVFPKPVQPGGPPLWIAGMSRRPRNVPPGTARTCCPGGPLGGARPVAGAAVGERP
ncbi:MAG: LLM class flavin-dependent oxidoreductase [Acidimicrobiales bacterium]